MKKVLIGSGTFSESLRLLSVTGTIYEDTFTSLISTNMFPNLEILRINCGALYLRVTELRQKLALMNLKKLNLRGCEVKNDLFEENVDDEALDRGRKRWLKDKVDHLNWLRMVNRKAHRD